MEFDLLTFIAQLINFAILVFLLNKFLFGRVKAAMDEREKKIAAGIEAAQKAGAEAEESARRAAEELANLESRRQEMIDAAKKEARDETLRIKEASRKEDEEQKKKWHLAFAAEQDNYFRKLKAHSGRFAWMVSEKMLRELSGAQIGEKAAEIFARKVEELGEKEASGFAAAANRSQKPLVILSSFPVDSAQKNRITLLMKEKVGCKNGVEFRQDADMEFGIEASAEGYRISWGGKDYTEAMQDEVLGVFKNDKGQGGYDG